MIFFLLWTKKKKKPHAHLKLFNVVMCSIKPPAKKLNLWEFLREKSHAIQWGFETFWRTCHNMWDTVCLNRCVPITDTVVMACKPTFFIAECFGCLSPCFTVQRLCGKSSHHKARCPYHEEKWNDSKRTKYPFMRVKAMMILMTQIGKVNCPKWSQSQMSLIIVKSSVTNWF